MPTKTVREMNSFERMRKSIGVRTFNATLISSFILGFVALLVGLGLYTYELASHYIYEAFNLSKYAAAVIEQIEDVEPFSDAVMEIYRSQTQEQLDQVGTEEYRSRFSALTERDDYKTVLSVLSNFKGSTDMDYIYMVMYDKDTSAMVYMADPDDPADALMPGEWEAVSPEGIDKFLGWDGSGVLYDIDKTEIYGWLCTSGVPIKNKSGEIVAFVLTDVSLDNVKHGVISFLVQYLISMTVITLIVAFSASKHIKRTLVLPLNKLTEAAHCYTRDREDKTDTRNDHFAELDISTGDEIEALALMMSDMERDLSNYIVHLTEVTAEKERISTELALSTQIQANMLPSVFPPYPQRDDFSLYASMTPAKEVGGDFYDFFLIDDDHLGLIIADVSGKGVPAALFMMASKILLENLALGGLEPSQLLAKANDQICKDNKADMFVTVWHGVLEISTGKVKAANAGHEYPVLKGKDGRFELFKDKHSFVLGGMEGVKYKQYEFEMGHGDILFLYTDGVPEATNKNKELFGSERLVEALNIEPDSDPKKLIETVKSEADKFVSGAEQFDDLTMLCVKRT